MRKRGKRNLWYYIRSFSAILVFCVLVMGGYLYSYFYQTIYKDFQKSNQDHLNSIVAQHENNMKILDDITIQLSLDEDNVEFLLEEQPEKSTVLKQQLYSYHSVSQFFDRIWFFYRGDRYLYSPSTSVDVDRFVGKGLVLQDCTAEKLEEILYDENSRMTVLPEQTADGYLAFNTGSEKGVLYVKLMEPHRNSVVLFLVGEDYYDSLLGMSEPEQRQSFICYQGTEVVSRGTLQEDFGKILGQVMEGEGEAQSLSGQQVWKAGREKYLITWEVGESGLIYATAESLKDFQNKLIFSQWGILFVLALCSIPTSIFFRKLSRELAGRVANINVLLSDEKSYDLDSLESGVRSLLEKEKENEDDTQTMRRVLFINNLVQEKFPDRQSVLEEAKKAGMNANRSYYAVILMGDHENSNENEAHKIMLHNIAERSGVDGYGIHLINSGQSLYVLFADSMQELDAATEELFVIGKNNCEEFVMAVSGVHTNLIRASEAYLEADYAYGIRFLVDSGQIIFFKDVKLVEKTTMQPETWIPRFRNTLRAGNELEIKMLIQEMCDKLSYRGQSLLAFRVLCNDIMHVLLTEWPETNVENIYNVFSLSECLTLQDFQDLLLELCMKLTETAPRKEKEEGDFVLEAVAYMKQHYREPELTMAFLAEYLGVSGVTLAVKFKNAFEISPSDYLAVLRMEEAKRLLKETDMQVKEVSQAVGYEDARVFMRRFKKYTGVTPGGFRETWEDAENEK